MGILRVIVLTTLPIQPLSMASAQPIQSAIRLGESNSVRLSWNARLGKHYQVERTSDLTGAWQNAFSPPESFTAATNTLECPVGIDGRGSFFRVAMLGEDTTHSNMSLIPAGSFQMGDPFGEGNADELPRHTVYVSAFYMDQCEVSKALWDSVFQWATNHGYTFGTPGAGKAEHHPVQSTTWYGMVKWCNARSEKEGRRPAYYRDASHAIVFRTGAYDLKNEDVDWASGYRLPTEAEWEKAARGGLEGWRYPWGNTISHGQANYYSATNYPYDVSTTHGYHPAYAVGDVPYTAPTASFAPNWYGLYDVVGNVWELCWDWYATNYYSLAQSSSDPRGPASGSQRVRRGGGWGEQTSAYECRLAFRVGHGPGGGGNRIGFRCVLPLGN